MLHNKATLRLLIDACLTPTVISYLRACFDARIDVEHGDSCFPPSTTDEEIFAYAVAEQRLVITANSADFLDIARTAIAHPGLGLVNDQNTRERQISSIDMLVRSILEYHDAGETIGGKIFLLRKNNRFVIRKLL